jgi:hypothetical protein
MIHQVANQLIVTHRGNGPDPGSIRQMSGNSAIQGSNAKRLNRQKRSQIQALDIDLAFCRDMAGSEACQRREPLKDFIILTDFSRCQGPAIERVSRRPKELHL